ncbi:prephenate dehydratase [Austwickia chelonae]|uniref:prephenate dehydratase n=1 Tax=Austwickia chelonae TaxID=100225 RepID=UPI000E22E3FA|nr:prephenate dehydratase [Austwickia chelonae]
MSGNTARPRIVYQGEPGCNGHLACQEVFPGGDAAPCVSFEEALDAVASGEADLAMIPIDNSLAGRVADIHNLLPTAGLHIVGEHFLRIRFELLGVPGATVESARTVHSHIHALGQCRRLIAEHGLRPVIAGDTAGSAREVRDWGDPAKLSIAPRGAAELYGLEVLRTDVEDDPTNMTRFVVLAREGRLPSREELQGPTMTSFVFRVRNIPSALYKALGGFATNGINMTKLESYMVGDQFAATMFLVEVEGHPEDPALARALEELGFFTTEFRMLGVYPAHAHRRRVGASVGHPVDESR